MGSRMNDQNMLIKRVVQLIALVVVVFSVVLIVLSYINSYQKLGLTFSNQAAGTHSTLYKLSKKGERQDPKDISPKDQSIKLKKGLYVLVTKGDDYDELSTNIDLRADAKNYTISPKYSKQKLASILKIEASAISDSIRKQVPKLSDRFVVDPGSLYETGEWYGTTIGPNMSSEELRLSYHDTYRLVAHKVNGSWQVVTIPPELVISHVKYPDIPRDVLLEVNKNPGDDN